jgi:hypothetical protein
MIPVPYINRLQIDGHTCGELDLLERERGSEESFGHGGGSG